MVKIREASAVRGWILYIKYSGILHYSELDADDMEEEDEEVTRRD